MSGIIAKNLQFQIFDAPQIVAHLSEQSGISEGESVHLECQYLPVDDPNLKVEWFKNDQPLFHANRYKMIQDFGFAILDILHLFAQVLHVTVNCKKFILEAKLFLSVLEERTPLISWKKNSNMHFS